MSAMVKFFAARVTAGRMAQEDVPARWRAAVIRAVRSEDSGGRHEGCAQNVLLQTLNPPA